MKDLEHLNPPAVLDRIERASADIGFNMASDRQTGAILRTLAAAKSGAFLELGTGTGISTCWILDGMDARSTLVSVESDEKVQALAQQHLGGDRRLTLKTMDGEAFLRSVQDQRFDFIFADTWPGKFYALEEALGLLNPGGLYIIDDLLPQPNWPDGHAPKVAELIATLERHERLVVTKLCWSTGLIIATRVDRP
ncbi:O-methyltransferase [Sorangium sp. So ce513]|jgi:predicted O-methyltransferase YrrM|uniref:O-methyltransferase n=1 Tax=Sorangium sp. So ce513 TaxID=3133315 RepID=UPI003F614F72